MWILNLQTSQLQVGDSTQATAAEGGSAASGGSKGQVEDLFSAHDFDIQIDLPASSEGGWSAWMCSVKGFRWEDNKFGIIRVYAACMCPTVA